MDEATALRQCQKLWKGSGLRITACPTAPTIVSTADAPSAKAEAAPTTPRRRSLADFEAVVVVERPKPPPKPPPRRPDIGLSLGIGRCTEGSGGTPMPLGKAHAKRPIGETATVAKAAAEAEEEISSKRAFCASVEQRLEAQRLQRACELENVANHPVLMRKALDAWRSELLTVH